MIFAMLANLSVGAKIQLPDILSDNMVLQQKAKTKIWGKASPNAMVIATTSWSKQKVTAKVSPSGFWELYLSTPEASYTPQTVTLSDGDKMELHNVLIGEVWFCSGQSNMEMPLKGFFNCPIMGANEEIVGASQYKGIRFATITHVPAIEPQESVPGKWKVSKPENAVDFSATAFYFAVAINKVLDVPVGIINCSWGGSTVEGWLPKDILLNYPDVDIKQAGDKNVREYMQPMIMYNGMLKPLENYTIKGFLWYQGESNIGRHATYAQRLATMVELWRKEWGLGELPFYFAEIAPFEYGQGDLGAYLREAQYKAQTLIPNSGMISTNDLVEAYESHNIHPKNKKNVGNRLAFMALKNTYAINGVADRGPEYKKMEQDKDKIILYFDNASEGFSRDDNMVGFEIAGEDRVFFPAEASTFRNGIVVSNKNVTTPVAVRYCFRNFLPGNVAGSRELPMVPFRTDAW